ncbi:PREDICTED: probable RNA helicase SDE3 [Amphimedon queenslandica]|uniref:RNA helicase n=1 Tax=Amphimedon queenslandica TaxID=400682 RepID=A0AAN0IWV7_AMPQE|nr:PREDICTED: probable RNA helicase SDE3 [Amphimedon queenslandica]|eukprot:XP_019848923.1 PREDICTED: probable RNA helicase SDE3 [Amphimedon queenslandica]
MLKYLHPAFSRMSQVKIIRITRKDSYNFSHNVMNKTLFDFRRDIVIGRHINDRILVIMTTYMSSLPVAKILNKVRFTHILLDEAAQVREPEAIAPLSLGDAATKVIIAGDTKQVGPSVLVLGEKSKEYGLAQSLLERLEKKYQEFAGKQQDFKYLKYLATNYRCCPEIVKFLSSTIYKYPIACAPEAYLNKQYPKIRYPLVFYWCNCNDTSSQDLKGLMEFVADAVVRQAQHYFSFWPHEWDHVKMRDVCIISPFRTQLNIIESKLKNVGLGKLTLLPSYLIQGHEFQAVFLTTFEPLESDGTSSNPTKSLTNPQIFNTAVSRSKSFVVAIGDPFSLLKAEKQFPECCWKHYLSICLDNDTIFFPESCKPNQRDRFKKKLSAELALPEKAKSAEYASHSHETSPFLHSKTH